MKLLRMPIPESASSHLLLDFPETDAVSVGEAPMGVKEASPVPVPVPDDRGLRIRALLSLRAEGDMRYRHDGGNPLRERYFGFWGVEGTRVLGTKLAHSRAILFPNDAAHERRLVDEAIAERGGADGIVVRDRTLVPTITAADCMPIWILDRHSGAFGVLHSGWRGTGILAVAVEELARRFGSPASSVSAILGPAIGSCCYDVPEERARLFLDRFGPTAARRDGELWRIDLREANIALAEAAGVGAVLSVDACTSCDPRLGSYRREGAACYTCMAAACGVFAPDDGSAGTSAPL